MPRERIFYSVGNENNPGNPFGRQHLVIDADGRARLDHYTVGPRFAWTGVVRPAVLDRIFDALGKSDFPALPDKPMPAGSTTRSLALGHGLAARSTFVAYHASASLPGYAVAFSLLDSIVRQLSEDTVPVVPASSETLVNDVRATETEEPREITPGLVYLFAYLPGHAVAHAARADLIERFAAGADEKLAHAIDLARRALKIDTSRLEDAERRISAVARVARLQIRAGTPRWQTIAEAVRPHLTTPLLQAAWSAGEAARLVAVSVALLAQAVYLRCAAPERPELHAFAEDRARALVNNAALLQERLEATGLPLDADGVARRVAVSSHHLETTSEGLGQLNELDRELVGVMDGQARRLDEPAPTQADMITVDADVLLAHGVESLAAAPLTRSRVRRAEGRVADVMRSAVLESIRDLDLSSQAVTDDDLVALAASPYARSLRRLDLRGNPITARGMEVISASPNLAGLQVVPPHGNPDDPCDPPQRAASIAPPTSVGRARSVEEMRFVASLEQCARCGMWPLSVAELEERAEAWILRAECSRCSTSRSFEFTATRDPRRTRIGRFDLGPLRSEILSAEQLLAAYERAVARVPAQPPASALLASARTATSLARSCA